MIRQQWESISEKVNTMSLRERVLIFAAAVFLLVSLVNAFFLDPVLLKQKEILNRIVQQDEKTKAVQAQIEGLIGVNSSNEISPQRAQINRLKQELEEGKAFLKSNRENLVPPDRMADLLRQVLRRNSDLQLLALHTLPPKPFWEKESANIETAEVIEAEQEQQIFKHGVEITLRGNYLELMRYLSSLEQMKTQMFWAKARLEVVKYPNAELTLTLYTLSLDKTWLKI